MDESEGALYLIPPAGVHPSSLTLVPCIDDRPTVIRMEGGDGSGGDSQPVSHVRVENVTIAHAAATFLHPYEISSGGGA